MDKPVIKIKLSKSDKFLEVAGYILLAALWGMAVYFYNNSPSVVPIHFNLAGEADGYGDRRTMFITPVLCTFMFFVLTEVAKYPQMFNYPITITPKNARRQYTIASRMMRTLKVAVVILFGVTDCHTYFTAINSETALGSWLLPVLLSIVFIPLGYFYIKSLKAE